MHTALIVDDERLARRELKRLLTADHGDQVHVVGEAATVAEATTLARLHDPDLVFLDIHLVGESGFDLLAHLDPAVEIVFVTAFDHHALRAFEVNALDYLLKPIVPERLAATIARLGAPAAEGAAGPSPLTTDDHLFLRLDDRLGFLRLRDIVAIRAARDNSIVHLADGREAQARKSLREWATRLPEQAFVRIHRSTIVNLEHLVRLEEWSHFSFRVHLRGLAAPLSMSRRMAARVRDRLG